MRHIGFKFKLIPLVQPVHLVIDGDLHRPGTVTYSSVPRIIVGAIYMLYLAWKTLTSSVALAADQTSSGFLNGFVLQFVNPKVYLYCLISMEVYILPYFSNQPALLLAFALLLALIGFGFTLCWSLFGSLFQSLFSTHARLTNTLLALGYCAIALFFE